MSHKLVCRMCLATGVRQVSIANTPLQHLYEKLTNIALNSTEKPKVACYLCLNQLRKCQEFKQRVIQADGLLTRMLESGSEITTTSVASVDRQAHKLSASLAMARTESYGMPCCQAVRKIKEELPNELIDLTCHENGMPSEGQDVPPYRRQSQNEKGNNTTSQKNRTNGFPEEPSKENTELTANNATKVYQTRYVLKKKKSYREKLRRPKKIANDKMTKCKRKQPTNNNVDESNLRYSKPAKRNVHLNELLRKRSREKAYECTICEYRCNQKGNLKRHLKTHTGEKPDKPYECTVCDYRCCTKTKLKLHSRVHTGEKPYECTVCEYRCSLKSHLKLHLRTHTGEKPYACSICEYRCSQKVRLKDHLRGHTGEKPHECLVCGYRCHVKSILKRHLVTHTGEKPYKCTECEYRCRIKSNLKRHLRTHTGEKPYKCTVCEYRCSVKSHLKIHLRTHTEEKPYECAICEFRCKDKGSLKRHLFRRH